MAQAFVTLPVLNFPVHVQNVIPVPQADYVEQATRLYPFGVFNVPADQVDQEFLKATDRIRGLQWTIDHRPEAGSPNSTIGRRLRAQYAVLWDQADHCLTLKNF